ncbi:Alpha-amylase [Pseudoalteromonas luteoviolacea B = ATCC 29581]|nr:Alpha-amylase [Pseudoalteromonas luteoviolacea B = ATCC 29581]
MIKTYKSIFATTKRHTKKISAALCVGASVIGLASCSEPQKEVLAGKLDNQPNAATLSVTVTKPVVYQVFTRLFGNTNTTNTPWGTLEENGVGKFADFTPRALSEIKSMGVTHIWYTGVLHHALVGDYQHLGISADDPDVVKGRAGSPYAIKDYFNVNPDLATDAAHRLSEFEALIARSHDAGLKVIIDIVPNHIARNYFSITLPEGVENFGAQDDTRVVYAKDNNFYYIPDSEFSVPDDENYRPLGGEAHPLADGKFIEVPAKWTGNGSRAAKPDINDWYETVKVNYGVKPDGSYDFASLPAHYASQSFQAHYAFWAEQTVPNSWLKFRQIVEYWLDKGVDGFRYDMAEMVPVEFWSYLNSAIKMKNPNAFILAEVYNPSLYRNYVQLGKMDYLYDKVGFYDSLKRVMQNKGPVSDIWTQFEQVTDIEQNMLHFLENHDEQRIASPEFAGNAEIGKPAMVVSHLISNAATMIYFGQTVGEDGSEDAGFGKPSRTSIFDYIGVPAHQAWMNEGKFDGGRLTSTQKALRHYYQRLLNLRTLKSVQFGKTIRLEPNDEQVMAFARAHANQRLIVVSNFSTNQTKTISLSLPLNFKGKFIDVLENHQSQTISSGQLDITLAPLASVVYQVESH